MLIDATHAEETRVAVIDGNRLVEFDYESKYRKPLKGSIFLAKVTRVEPSLQAAFVNFGGNRHGFLPFSEIHPDYFRIPISDREALIAEQEELLRQDEEFEEDEDEDRAVSREAESADDEDDHEDEDVIEEIGGESASLAAPEDDEDDEAPKKSRGRGGRGRGRKKEDAESAETDSEDPEDPAEDAAADDGEGDSESEGENDGEGDDRGRRGRRGGRGRGRFNGRGRGRAAHRSRQVEVLGGTEYDDDGQSGSDRSRFALRRKYKIQEVIKRGQIMLIQVSREERGNKGAAVSTYLSLPGRYGVLMPNSPRAGGVSRKIASFQDRARLRDMLKEFEVPKGMSVILRTAGVQRTKPEIKRDLDYLMRLWDEIRELTLQSSAPAMIYEEADLMKRAIRDLYGRDIEDIIVAGEEGQKNAKKFMKMMMPSHVAKVKLYKEEDVPLFHKYGVESQISDIGEPSARLKSGGYLVINPTEALVSIDVNSGRATKERHIEETALNTNLEAAEEVARQLRLRDLGGLVVIDFIDMEDRRNNARVERKLKEALSGDRARIQMGRISSFGLLELSRQRLNPSLTESQFHLCDHCNGRGHVRTPDATTIMLLRAIEEEGIKRKASELLVHVSDKAAIYLLNHKRAHLDEIEAKYGLKVIMRVDSDMGSDRFRIEVLRNIGDRDEDDHDEDEDAPRENGRDGNRDRGARHERERGGREGRGNREGRENREPREPREAREPREPRDGDEEGRGEGERSSRRRGRRGGRGRNRGERGDRLFRSESGEFERSELNDGEDSAFEEQTLATDAPEIEAPETKAAEDAPAKKGRVSRAKAAPKDEETAEEKPAKKTSSRAKKADVAEEVVADEKPAAKKPAARSKKAAPSNDDSAGADMPAKAEKAEKKAAKTPPPPPAYEVVQEAAAADAGSKKRGWWNRLTE